MGLQFIFGASGAGKSYYIYHKIIKESMEHPEKQYIVLVPEQFTMQTQKDLVSMHPRKGIMNIDVLSFERMAIRVLEETGDIRGELLEETGKSMVLRRVAQEKKKELKMLGAKMDKQGYISQLKSIVSELRQYEISSEDLEELLEDVEKKPELYYKLKDISVLYRGFFEYLGENFYTQEEVLDALGRVADQSKKLKNCVLVLDGYTGFTPIQMNLLEKLMVLSEEIYVTVTIDKREDPYQLGSPHQLFYLSKQTVSRLCKLAGEKKVPWSECWVPEQGQTYVGRFQNNSTMKYLEENIFRYRKAVEQRGDTEKKNQEAVFIREVLNPGIEMEETAAMIRRMVRQEGYRYGDFAVISGDMETYAPAASRAFEKYEIPCFIDQKHSIFMNPFVEYIRAAVDMIVENFSYESVFRLLRCGLTNITIEEADHLENYVIAMGIRGFSRWKEEWVRNYRGQHADECVWLNQIRTRLVDMWEPFYLEMKKQNATIRDYAKALYDYICENHIEEQLKGYEEKFREEQNMAFVKEYSQIYRIVMDLLDKLVEILGEQQVRPKEFKEILDAGLSEAKVGVIPPASDQVLVGEMERTRLKDIKVLFFVGVNEGKIPKESRNGKLISDLNREELKKPLEERGLSLAPTAKETLYTQKFYLYLNLTKPSKQVYLSYSRLNSNGEVLSPSFLIAQIEKLFPNGRIKKEENLFMENPYSALDYLSGEIRKEEKKSPIFEELFSWFKSQDLWEKQINRLIEGAYYVNPEDSLGRGVAHALYGIRLENSATRLEQFAKCACSHFLSYGLRLRERVQYEFTMADLGSLLHNSLDLFAKKIYEQGRTWIELEDEERDALAEDCVNEVVERSGETILLSNARNAYTINRTKRMVKRSAWALQYQLQQGKFYPALTEWAFDSFDRMESMNFALDHGEQLFLRGRIDRIDICEDDKNQVLVKIIDYKSGSAQLELVKLYYGLQLQLALYMNAAIELEQKRFPNKKVKPAGIFYYNIKDPMLNREYVKDFEHPENDILKKMRMDGIVGEGVDILENLDHELACGKVKESLVVPVKYTAKGRLSSNSKVASQEQFQDMIRYVQCKAREIGQNIVDGNVNVNPYERQQENACEYCPYKSVCGFDENIPGYTYRRLQDYEREEVWKKISETVNETKDRKEE